MAQSVGRNPFRQGSRTQIPVEESSNASNGDSSSAMIQEQRLFFFVTGVPCGVARQDLRSRTEVGADGLFCFGTERHDPFFGPFSSNLHQSCTELHIIEIDPDQLADP